MAKRAGKVLGLDKNLSDQQLKTALSDRGLDVANLGQLRAYLMNNKEMIDGPTSGLAKFFGLSGLSLDSFLKAEDDLLSRLATLVLHQTLQLG